MEAFFRVHAGLPAGARGDPGRSVHYFVNEYGHVNTIANLILLTIRICSIREMRIKFHNYPCITLSMFKCCMIKDVIRHKDDG